MSYEEVLSLPEPSALKPFSDRMALTHVEISLLPVEPFERK
jgi:hypothetical protein